MDGRTKIYGVLHRGCECKQTWTGIYYLTFDYTDQAGNAAETVTRTVNVVDTTAPVISLNGDSNITHEAGTALTMMLMPHGLMRWMEAE